MLYKYFFTLHSIHTRDRCPDSKKKGGRRGVSNAFPCTCYTQGCDCKSTHMNLCATPFLLPWHNGQCQNEEVSRVEVGGTHMAQAENIVSINRKLFHIVSFYLIFQMSTLEAFFVVTVKLCYSESGRPRHIFSLLPSSRYSQMTNLPRETTLAPALSICAACNVMGVASH